MEFAVSLDKALERLHIDRPPPLSGERQANTSPSMTMLVIELFERMAVRLVRFVQNVGIFAQHFLVKYQIPTQFLGIWLDRYRYR